MPLITRITHEFAKLLLPQSKYLVKLRQYAFDSEKFPVFLTFDDGPHPDHTPRLLDQLAEFEAKATFFVLGENARRWPDIVRRTYDEGHAIGSHSWNHWSSRNTAVGKWIEDVRRARHDLEDIVGMDCCLFRPPYGELTPFALFALLSDGFRIIHWHQDTKDFEATTDSQISQWFRDNEPTPGSVVLLHDDQALTTSNLAKSCEIWHSKVEYQAIPMSLEKNDHTA